jgi:hypothetical protein
MVLTLDRAPPETMNIFNAQCMYDGSREGKVRLHRYICLWGASERKLGKSLKPNQKDIRTNQGKRARHPATKEATP